MVVITNEMKRDQNLNIVRFDEHAKDYAKRMLSAAERRRNHPLEVIVAEQIGHLTGMGIKPRINDFGCGDGYRMRSILEKAGRPDVALYGWDISTGMIREALRNNESTYDAFVHWNMIAGIPFVNGNMGLSLRDTLSNIASGYQIALNNMAQVTDGTIIFDGNMIYQDEIKKGQPVNISYRNSDEPASNVKLFTMENVLEMSDEAGIKINSIYGISKKGDGKRYVFDDWQNGNSTCVDEFGPIDKKMQTFIVVGRTHYGKPPSE